MKNVSLSLVIIHAGWSSERRGTLAGLMRSLGGLEEIRKKVKLFHIERDTAKKGVWPPARQAWKKSLYSGASHHIVLQDDALACRNFLDVAARLCALKPEELICYFSMRKAAAEAAEAGKNWFITNEGAWGTALCFPHEMLAGILAWEKTAIKRDCPYDDVRVAAYLKWGPGKGKRVWHPCPCLVEHAAPSDSLLGHSNRNRVAKVWIGDRDPLEIDWGKDADSPHKGGGGWNDKKWLIKTS